MIPSGAGSFPQQETLPFQPNVHLSASVQFPSDDSIAQVQIYWGILWFTFFRGQNSPPPTFPAYLRILPQYAENLQ